MKSKVKSFLISIVIGAILGIILIRPLMVSSHAFDDHEKTSINQNIFAAPNLGQTMQAMFFGVLICVFLNFWLQRRIAKSKDDKK